MANQVVFNITFAGNAATFTSQLSSQMGGLQAATNKATGAFSKFQANLISLNQGIQVLRDLSATLREVSEPGLKLNAAMQDLSAITGVTGSKLQEIEKYARDAAKTFGGSAAQGVESYKLILSKLSSEIAKVPAALSAMGQSAMTLSKTMGNDVVAATQVLTTAMNQYQVSLDDPLKASGAMAEMMNIMAAAAREGSAELPEIQTALEQAGMAAKMAGVSFAETNAAIQVLDKAGKKGAEGGVAIRNVLATLSEGRFLPKEVISELNAAGVSIETLADKTLPFAERLAELKKIIGDSALITKLFGKENSNAALALISGIPLMNQYTVAIQGTKSAEEQAAVVMQSKEQQLARIKAKIDDYKISIFNLTGNMLPFAEIATSALVPISQMIPLISALSAGIKAFSFTGIIAGFASFKIAAIASCRAVGVAIMSIPVFGWIAAALAALGAAAVWAWNKFEGFRKTVLGVWEVIKLFGETLYNSVLGTIKSIISGLGSLGSALLKLFKFDFKGAVQETKNAIASFSKANPLNVGISLVTADYKGAWAKGQQKGAESWAKRDKKALDEAGESASDYSEEMNRVLLNTNKVAGESGGLSKEMTKLREKLVSIARTNELFGTAQDAVTEKMDTVKNAIKELIEKGYKIQSKEVQSAIEILNALQSENIALAQSFAAVSFQARMATDAIKNSKSGKISTPDIGKMKVKNINTGIIALDEYSNSIKKNETVNGLFKDSFGMLEGNISLTKTAITSLINDGFSPSSREVKKLMGDFREYSSQLEAVTTQQNMLGSSAKESLSLMGQNFITIGEAISGVTGNWISFVGKLLSTIPILINQVSAFSMAIVAGKQAESTANAGAAITGAVSGSNTMPYPFNLIAMGISIAATIAALATSVPKFAAGGVVSGPTMALVGEYPGASSNPEVIAPLSKLKSMLGSGAMSGEVRFEIEGDKLVGVLNKYYNKRRMG